MEKRRKPPADDPQLSAGENLAQPGGDDVGVAGVANFDVFLSHNRLDKPVVERIAEHLRREGLRPFLDVWDLTVGGRWQRELADGLARSKTCAVFVGPHSFGQWQLEELELAVVWANRRDGFRVFAVLLPGVEDPFDVQRLPSFLSTRTWVDLRGGATSRSALQRLVNGVRGVAQGPAVPAGPVGSVVPYRGLASFEEEHAEFFFGRERDVQRLLEVLKASRLLCVVGPSGCGKSSLVRAGLIPRLRDSALPGIDHCRICVLRPGAHPLQALSTQLARLDGGGSMQATLDGLAADRRALQLAVSLALGADAPGSRVLVVVDQLEEVFTLCNDERERESFFANLLHAASAREGQTLVVLTMRADFYARCAEYPELAQRTARSLALVGPMDTDELRQAVEEPARRVGLFFESGLVRTILDDVGPEPGALPLLEHALLEVWRRRVGDQLTLEGYVDAGGVEGALAQRAEGVFSGLTAEQQQIARRTLLRLTQPGEGTDDTRRRATRRELTPAERDDSFDMVLGHLVDARLLTTGRDETGVEVVDVSHEALIRGWPRMRGWIEADRAGLLIHRRLTDAAREWDAVDREPAALYRGARLAAASEWAVDHADDLTQLERDFLASSRAAERSEFEATKLRTRRLRVLASGLAVLAGTVAVLAVWALDQRSTARSKESDATSLALASSALPLLDSRPDVSLLLAFEAYRVRPRSSEARGSVLAALTAARDPGVLAIMHGHADTVYSVASGRAGRMLASGSGDGTVRLWDVRTHRQIGVPLRGHTGSVRGVAFGRDRRTLASAGDDGTVRLWDVTSHRQIGVPLRGHTGSVRGVAFGRDRRTLASASSDRTVRLWDLTSHRQIGAPLRRHRNAVNGVAFGRDGRTLASGGDDGTVRLWHVRTHKQLGLQLTGHTNAVNGVAFGRDGRTLASASSDRTVRLWDLTSHRQTGAPLTGHTNAVNGVAFGSDGRTLASASADKTVRLWDVRTQKQIGVPLTGHASDVLGLAFAPGRLTLASGAADATIGLWDVRRHKQVGEPLTGHTSGIFALAFGRGGAMLASASADTTIRLWDVRTHKQIGRPLTGHNGPVVGVAFSRDGPTLASAGLDTTVRLWDVTTHKQLGTPLTGHTDAVSALAFSPNGRTLASGSVDHTIRLWTGLSWRNLDELQTRVCKLVGGGLSRSEWEQYASGISYRQSCP